MKNTLILSVTLGGMLWTVQMSPASTIAQDSFNYAAGTLIGSDGGIGWAAPWGPGPSNAVNTFANVVDVTANPLGVGLVDGGTLAAEAYSFKPASANINLVAAYRPLASPLTTPFYAGYLVRLEAGTWGNPNTFAIHLSDGANNTASFNFGIRASTTGASLTDHFMIRSATGSPLAGDAVGGLINPGEDYYLVARLTPNAGVYDTIDFWLNPAFDELNSPDASLTITSGALSSISHVLARTASMDNDDRVLFDELTLATDWGDVVPVPEPGMFVLLGLGVLVMVMRFRR